MIVELRQYRMRPGQRERWIKFMEDVIIPFQVAQGMVVIASFVGEVEEDLYVWMRRFDDEAHRKRLYAAVYESDKWQNEISPQVEEMIDRSRTVVTRLHPTAQSVIR